MPYLHQLYMIWLVEVLLNDYTRTTNLGATDKVSAKQAPGQMEVTLPNRLTQSVR